MNDSNPMQQDVLTEEGVQALMAEANAIIGDSSDDTIGSTVVQWFELKAQYDQLKGQQSTLNEKMEYLEAQIIEKMEAAEVDQISTPLGSISMAPKSMPSPEDFFKFVQWIAEDINERIGFLQKRVSDTAINDYLHETGQLPPGIKTYVKQKLTKRKAKK